MRLAAVAVLQCIESRKGASIVPVAYTVAYLAHAAMVHVQKGVVRVTA